jgi:S1-C subfamily serine protease
MTDLAVVRADVTGLAALPLANPSALRVGQLVVAIGNPFQFERSISLGVISALDRFLPTPRGGMMEGLIQTDAAINPGNSGGPLVDVDGKVVGVNTAVIPYAQGMGFAIPSATANWVAAVLISRGAVNRPYLGIAARGEELDSTVSREAGQPRAVRVLGVGGDTPAETAGLRRGDLLLTVNGDPVGNVDDLQRIMVLSERSDVTLQIIRNAKRREFVITPSRRASAA